MTRQTLAFLAAFTLGLSLSACGPLFGGSCSPSSCGGCCDASGKCSTGDTATACGAGGVSCNTCSGGQVCEARVCVAPANDSGTGGGAGGGSGTGGSSAVCTRLTPACADAATASLDLTRTTPAAGAIVNTADGTGFKSTVDSSAGGFTPTQSFVYARFTPTGLEKLPLSDVQASDSMDWDIAFRRFMIRLNGGDSGPSCVAAAALPAGTLYDGVASAPSGLVLARDNFLTDAPACTFVDDGSGLTSSPATALASFYEYTGCVKMTDRVFVVQTSDAKMAKLTVSTYYSSEAAQAACNSNGTPGTGGTIRLRWAWLP